MKSKSIFKNLEINDQFLNIYKLIINTNIETATSIKIQICG